MYYIGLDVHKKTISYCVKDASGRIQQEGKVVSTRRELDCWMKTLRGGLFDCRPSVQIDQVFGFVVTRERRTASRVVRSLREFASPDSKSIQPSLKPSIIRILGMGFSMPCERNSVPMGHVELLPPAPDAPVRR
jgi:hypothetical protein